MQPLQPPDFFGWRCENLHFQDRDYFKIDQTFFLNLAFLALSGFMRYLGFFEHMDVKQLKEMTPKSQLLENILKCAALTFYFWLGGGLIVEFLMN